MGSVHTDKYVVGRWVAVVVRPRRSRTARFVSKGVGTNDTMMMRGCPVSLSCTFQSLDVLAVS